MKTETIFAPAFEKSGKSDGVFVPFDPGTRVLPAGWQAAPTFKAIPVDIVFEKDVAVTLRDGKTIYVDVLRPAGSERVPVIVAWSPYGKAAGTGSFTPGLFASLGMKPGQLSGLEKFEGPDPAYWVAQGYAICNPDSRGIDQSEGDIAVLGHQEGEDCHDLIEWLAVQDWCNGKVGMSGTSYLAASQWYAAAEQPPHLAAINPVEGFNDIYRHLVQRGGMPDHAFFRVLDTNYAGKNRREDAIAEAIEYPLVNDLWESKVAELGRITVPAYIVASYSNTLHTPGTFRGWRSIDSSEKWLRIHNSMEWPDYYDEGNRDDLRRFFDHFLKGENNGWEETPRVRYSVLDLEGGDRTNLPAADFPPQGVVDTKFFLDGRSRSLKVEAPETAAVAAYNAETYPGLASFTIRFDKQTELVGYPKLNLFVEGKGTDDMDLFFVVQKLDAHGSLLQAFTVPNTGAMMMDLTDRGASILRYKGPNGRVRVSLRGLDEKQSTDAVPVQSFTRVEKLAPGQIVELEVALSPVGLVVYPGEQLRLVVSAMDTLGGMMPGQAVYEPGNKGQHVIHTGGEHLSYLRLPVKTA